MSATTSDTYHTKASLAVNGEKYTYYNITALEKAGLKGVDRLPMSLKVLLENLLRNEDGQAVSADDIKAMVARCEKNQPNREIAYHPARVLMQDFTGVPAVVDLATMRDAIKELGGDAQKINPQTPVDLVIDHSVMVNHFGSADAFEKNVDIEFQQNAERYKFLHWGQNAFDNFRVVPPGTGICHQVNLEYLGQTVWSKTTDGETTLYPDTCVGTDSHTTMINALAVLGWGVGGIEAEAAMLGQPVTMLIPDVIGFKFKGSLKEGTTATDLVLNVVEILRKKGVVGKFVEFFGDGLAELSLADRATISNMAPEYGATCGFFPIDEETISYLKFSGREPAQCAIVEAYAKAQGMWRQKGAAEATYTDVIELDLATIVPSMAGPKRPQDRLNLADAKPEFEKVMHAQIEKSKNSIAADAEAAVADHDFALQHGSIVYAAITSCTNTSNPAVMLGAGLVARNAVKKGLKVKPWVKTSLAPGSQVVTDYLVKANLQDSLDSLGFNLVGYGCTTCIGNSGEIPAHILKAALDSELTIAAVLSGNRNFEGRISPYTQANYLASPMLVVCYALAGNMRVDLYKDPLGQDSDGNDVFMKDIWPSNAEIQACIAEALTPEMYKNRYADVFAGPKEWQAIDSPKGTTYQWENNSTYIQRPSFFDGMGQQPQPRAAVKDAHILALLGDSITTDHISPAGNIKEDSPAGRYLAENGVEKANFNSYGSRRGNHEVMMRGTFANVRLSNELTPGVNGGVTRKFPENKQTSIYDAAMAYIKEGTALVVVAGKEYGTGSSRDWAAKGTALLGVSAVITESFERIHRSNLIGMGVLPLQFKDGQTRQSLALKGDEKMSLSGLEGGIKAAMDVTCEISYKDGRTATTTLLCRIDTDNEVEYYNHGGILHYVLRNLNAQ